MKTAYDDPNFARKIHKYKGCRSNITLFKRALLPDWSVFEKVSVKIKKIGKNGKIGKSNTQRRKKKGDIEDERDEKGLLDSNYSNDLTKDKTIGKDGVIVIDETLNDAKAPEENNEVVALTTDIMKDVAEGDDVTGDMEVFEADAEGNELLEFNTEMILDESIDAQGSEAVKGLLNGEFNMELIPDKGGGRKKRQFGECLKT